jgi:hypothetical protein
MGCKDRRIMVHISLGKKVTKIYLKEQEEHGGAHLSSQLLWWHKQENCDLNPAQEKTTRS